MLRKLAQKADYVIVKLNYAGFLLGAASVIFTMLLITVGAVSRYVLGAMIPGVVEGSSVLMLLTAAFAIGYTQTRKGHVRVDLVTMHLPQTIRAICEDIFSPLVGMTFCAAGIWKGFAAMLMAWKIKLGLVWLLNFPGWLAFLAIVLGLSLLFLALLTDLVRSVALLCSSREAAAEKQPGTSNTTVVDHAH